MKQTGLTVLAPVLPDCNWRALARLIRWRRRRLTPVPQLHFLTLFVIPPGRVSDQAQLGFEANFDGCKERFLDDLIAANDEFLHFIFERCGYVATKNATLRDYILFRRRKEHIFYIAHPGHSTERIDVERRLAEHIEARVALLQQPTGRRHDIIREVWQGLSDEDRQTVLAVPDEPIWVKKSGNLTATLATIAKWLAYGIGWIVLLLILARQCGCGAYAPPEWVLGKAWGWTKVLFWFVAGAGGVFFILFIFEFPRGLRLRTMAAIFFKKVLGFVRLTLCASPGFAGIVGLLTLWSWRHHDFAALLSWVASWLFTWWAFAIVLTLVILYLALLRCFSRMELADSVYEMKWDRAHMMQMRAREEEQAQNHFISIVDVRPHWIRRRLLRCVLFVINWGAWLLHNPQGLFNSQSIHFARWCLLKEQKLLFITNYNGGFGGYLDIFATLGATGVSALWGHTVDFPRTFLMFGDGCRDEQRFKARARGSQVETLLWYRRYPDLTNTAIARNAAIRKDLRRFANNDPDLHEADLDVFLRRFAVRNP